MGGSPLTPFHRQTEQNDNSLHLVFTSATFLVRFYNHKTEAHSKENEGSLYQFDGRGDQRRGDKSYVGVTH